MLVEVLFSNTTIWLPIGPRYLSGFHQYEGHDVEQQLHRIHSYKDSHLARSSGVCRFSHV